jgi:hypothetical protein
MRLSLALLCLAITGLTQPLTIGAKGGVRLTGDPEIYDRSNSKPYLVGPMVEVRLPYRFAFEADALYSRLGNTTYIPLIANESFIRTIANSWEFPLLVKYRLPVPHAQPYVSAGVAPRRAGGRINTIHYGFYPGDVTFSSVDWHAHDRAFVLGGGVGVTHWHLRITTEIRYLRWRVPAAPSSDDAAYYLRVPQNEAQVLVGIGWPAR